MELIFEILIELILEGTFKASKSKKIPKYIRYPLIIIIVAFFIAVIGLILFTGALILKENLTAGILIILIGLFMLIMSIIKFRKTYLIKSSEE